MRPSLSVIMPNYNHAPFIPMALEAILSQSHPAEEIIIVDDASTDDSVAVIENFAKRHSCIRFERLKTNQGPNPAVNRALSMAKGNYLAFCSADDRVLPSFFETALFYVQQHPDVGLFCSKVCFFDTDSPGILKAEKTWLDLQMPCEFSPANALKLFRTTNFRISTPASIFKKSSVLKMGGYRIGTKMLADWLLNCQIALNDGFIYAPVPLASLRQPTRAASYSSRIYKNKKGREEAYVDVIQAIEQSPAKDLYKKSLIIYQLGFDILIFLIKNHRYWNYLPSLFLKKIKMTTKNCARLFKKLF